MQGLTIDRMNSRRIFSSESISSPGVVQARLCNTLSSTDCDSVCLCSGFPLSVQFHQCFVLINLSYAAWTMVQPVATVLQRQNDPTTMNKNLTVQWQVYQLREKTFSLRITGMNNMHLLYVVHICERFPDLEILIPVKNTVDFHLLSNALPRSKVQCLKRSNFTRK